MDLEDGVPEVAAHVFAGDFALRENAVTDHRVHILPDGFTGGGDFEQMPHDTGADQHVAVRKAMGAGDLGGEKIRSAFRLVMPDRLVRAVSVAGDELIGTFGIDRRNDFLEARPAAFVVVVENGEVAAPG